MEIEALKKIAGERAVEFVTSGMVIGLGTGSTAVHAVRKIGRLWQDGTLTDIVCIPTSEETRREAERLTLPLTTFDEHPVIDITIDGADEIDPNFDLIKGLGGALLREKIVAGVSQRMVIVADERKDVPQLGTRTPVPVEVIPFAEHPVRDQLIALGARVEKRHKDDSIFITDEQNIILDSYFDGGIVKPNKLNHDLLAIPGVVDHGLFLHMATDVILATSEGIVVRQKGVSGA